MESIDEVAAKAVAVLAERHPAAVFDRVGGGVSRPGFLVGPGVPGQGRARVQHRTLLPGALSGATPADASAEEFVAVEAYADLLREHGWEVRYRPTTRPNLLVSPPSAALPGDGDLRGDRHQVATTDAR